MGPPIPGIPAIPASDDIWPRSITSPPVGCCDATWAGVYMVSIGPTSNRITYDVVDACAVMPLPWLQPVAKVTLEVAVGVSGLLF